MIVRQLLIGGDRNYSYIVADREGGVCVIIDPSYNPKMILEEVKKLNLEIKYILCTHDHPDHTNGNMEIKKATGKEALLYGDTDRETGMTLSDGAILPLGEITVKALSTPGHTKDSMCFYIGDSVFTGDTLFIGKIGGTFGRDNAFIQYNSIHEKLMTLPYDTLVYPGHNYGIAPSSTIEYEKNNNPFILQPDFEAFFHLKNNWEQYKVEHGIK